MLLFHAVLKNTCNGASKIDFKIYAYGVKTISQNAHIHFYVNLNMLHEVVIKNTLLRVRQTR